jgi:diadenosine tetraphosphate (Ap4A) HIT family hydrolase
MSFTLHPQLAKDSMTIGDFPLCRLLLINDRQYPWTVLVPKVTDIREIYQLPFDDQIQLICESSHLCQCLNEIYQADKMNIAAIGNKVPQLHIHHIVRYNDDAAWPEPVWGKHPAIAYSTEQQQSVIDEIQHNLLQNTAIPFIPTESN